MFLLCIITTTVVFCAAPQWPPAPHTLRSLYERAKDPFLLALLIVILAIGAGTLCVLLIPLWVILAPLALAVAPFAALVLLLVVRARSNARAEFEKQRAAAEKGAPGRNSDCMLIWL